MDGILDGLNANGFFAVTLFLKSKHLDKMDLEETKGDKIDSGETIFTSSMLVWRYFYRYFFMWILFKSVFSCLWANNLNNGVNLVLF